MASETAGVADVLDALRRRWVIALLVAIPLFAGVVVYVQSLPDLYDGESVVAFSPQPDATIGSDTIRVVVPKYVAYLSARATAREVAERLDEDEGTLSDAVDASVAVDTANLTVKVRLPDPERAAEAANAFAQEAVRFSNTDTQLQGQVVAPALPPTEPASPPRTLLLAGGLVLALLGGATAAVVLDRSRPRVTDALSLALSTGHGTVGRIPARRIVRRASIVDGLNDPALGTAVRAMRTQLEQHSRTLPVNVVAVTSPSSGDGKSTIAALLAASLARVDASVLLVDGDMRRPRLEDLFDLKEGAPGLADVLDGRAPLKAAVQPGGLKGLSVVATARREDAGDLLARKFHGVLEVARAEYDVVIVDCPPLLATDDARTLALMCDGTLLVVSTGSELALASEAGASLDSLGVRVLGSVLNRTRGRSRGAMGSYGAYRPTG